MRLERVEGKGRMFQSPIPVSNYITSSTYHFGSEGMSGDSVFRDYCDDTDASIRAVQNRHSFLFGPTYLQLIQDDLEVVKPFTILKRPRPAGKGKLGMPEMDEGGVEFELEKNWILAHAAGMRVDRDAAIAKKLADEAEWAAGGGIECGCCFGDYLPVSLRSEYWCCFL